MAKWSKGQLLKPKMKIKAESKFIRTSPRKLKLVADLIRPMSLDEALTTLKYLRKRAAVPILKTLKQAMANAVNNNNLNKDTLTIHTLEINTGPTYKRWQPVSRGRAHSIKKRTSHIKLVLVSQNQGRTFKKGQALKGEAKGDGPATKRSGRSDLKGKK